jgi:hypothetical protein
MNFDWQTFAMLMASGKAVTGFISFLVFLVVLLSGRISIAWLRRHFGLKD